MSKVRFDFVSEDVALSPGAQPVQRDYVDHPGAVGIVALRQIDGVDHILLLSQYRHPIRAKLWEIPAGLLDVDGEHAVQAAQRELAEEAQLAANQWDVLVDYFTTPGGNSESIRIFLARDLRPAPWPEGFEPEAEEIEMEPVWLPLATAVELAHAGQLHNPSTVVGILSCASALTSPSRLRAVESPWLR
ncbi:MAG: NUDIX hydrolase [Buchananella hordeovulneris]|nr:NUDIX hydrolase [Buchananella hordeovulneris]